MLLENFFLEGALRWICEKTFEPQNLLVITFKFSTECHKVKLIHRHSICRLVMLLHLATQELTDMGLTFNKPTPTNIIFYRTIFVPQSVSSLFTLCLKVPIFSWYNVGNKKLLLVFNRVSFPGYPVESMLTLGIKLALVVVASNER